MRHFSLLLSFLLMITSCATEPDEPENPQPTIQQYSLTVNATTGGTVNNPGSTFASGSSVTLTATPNSEYLFSGWSNGSTENPLTLTITSNLTISANFTKRQYPLQVNTEGQGTVSETIVTAGKSPTNYNAGTVVRLTANPAENWTFLQWSGAVSSTANPLELTIDEAKTVTATFRSSVNDGDWQLVQNITAPAGVTVEYQTYRDSKEDLFYNYRINGLSDTIRLVAFSRRGETSMRYPSGDLDSILLQQSASEEEESPITNFIISEFERIEYLNRTLYVETQVTSQTSLENLKSTLSSTLTYFGDTDADDYDTTMIILHSRNYFFGGLALDRTTIYNGPYNFTPYVIAHEIGHVWSLREGSPVNWEEWGTLAENNYVSDYGETAVSEHFAEAFSFYFTGTTIAQPLVDKLLSYGLILPSSSKNTTANALNYFTCGLNHKH